MAENVTSNEKSLLRPNVGKIKTALPLLEKDFQKYSKEYESYRQKYETTEKKLQTETGFFTKNKLKVNLKVYRVQKDRYLKKRDKQHIQLAIYYCILSVFNESDISKEKLAVAKSVRSKIEVRQKWAAKKRLQIERNIQNIDKKIIEIGKEQEKVKEVIEKLKKRLEVLNYKKSWSNMSERLSLKSKITFQKSKLLKLEGEILMRHKSKNNADKEKDSMILEETESKVALKVIDSL